MHSTEAIAVALENADDAHTRPPCWPIWPALATILAGAAVLRAWRLDQRSLWFDEAYCWGMAKLALNDLRERAALDCAPPLYYLALKVWMSCFGNSVIAMRALSVAWGVATCAGMYLAVTAAFRLPGSGLGAAKDAPTAQWAGLCTAAFVAVSVLHVRWSGEVKMYAQGAALAAFSAWLLLRALAPSQPSWRRWGTYAATAIAFGYTHNYAPFSLFAQGAFAGGWLAARSSWNVRAIVRSPQCRAALVTGFAIVAAGSAWIPVLLAQLDGTSKQGLAPLRNWSLSNACYELLIDPQDPCSSRLAANAASVAALAVLLMLLWRPAAGDFFLFLSATLPLCFALAISLADRPIFQSRYLAFAHLFLLAAAARLVARIDWLAVRNLVAGMIVIDMVVVNQAFWNHLDLEHKPGTAAAAAYIERSRAPGEPVVISSPFYFSPVLYYLRDRENCFLFDDGEPLEAYEGPAIISPADRIDAQGLARLAPRRFWAVNVVSPRTSWQHEPLNVDNGWREFKRERFREAYYIQGAVEVVEYRAAEDFDRKKHGLVH